ncbi:conserved hypothetical protein [Treponema primitia ZAS-2]|uniref:Outer membrane protein beta-barrel domain-containing protein n=1 Tax=Treponema primitia (strain ATCC BAA-887 / DSM 12427 / ZAS-2) TaxID=545694 RepID=F5YHG0_TREPZ|nr:hypothetical protein [Treponema primitia]AEF86102.1 conserved hypothetical protein [Treponema primitia ZAS-2]
MAAAKGWFLCFLMLLGVLSFPLAAQDFDDDNDDEGDNELPLESDWSGVAPELYSRGDKTFTITLGTILPLFFAGVTGNANNVGVGGAGSLSYNYFFTSHIFFGGELGGMFAPTISEGTLFLVPIGLRVGYQFIVWRFEFPLSLMVGFAPEKYQDYDYFGFFMKPQASVFWRFNPDWSFGINAAYWWVPQWADKTSYGNFLELTVSARYHF